MTAVPRELAHKQPANLPAARDSRVIDGEARPTRPTIPVSGFGWFGLFILALLFAGFLLSLSQQAS